MFVLKSEKNEKCVFSNTADHVSVMCSCLVQESCWEGNWNHHQYTAWRSLATSVLQESQRFWLAFL